jgi:hypothetical protein
MYSQITLQHIGIDTYLMAIRLQLRIDHAGRSEEYMRFLGFTNTEKPTALQLSEWVEAQKAHCYKQFEATYINATPVAGVVAPVVPITPSVVPPVVEAPVVIVPAITAPVAAPVEAPKPKGRAKKATETVETTATPVVDEPVHPVVTETLLVNDDPLMPVAEEKHDDIMFNRTDRVHITPIMDKLASFDKNWKTNTALITKLKAVLDLANEKWIFIRDGKLNKALPTSVIWAAQNDVALPEPHYISE